MKAFTKTHYEKPAPGDAILAELDEMWLYLSVFGNSFIQCLASIGTIGKNYLLMGTCNIPHLGTSGALYYSYLSLLAIIKSEVSKHT